MANSKSICVGGFSEETVRKFVLAGYKVKHIPNKSRNQDDLVADLKKFLFSENGIYEYPKIVLEYGMTWATGGLCAWAAGEYDWQTDGRAISGGAFSFEGGACCWYGSYYNFGETKGISKYTENIRRDDIVSALDAAIVQVDAYVEQQRPPEFIAPKPPSAVEKTAGKNICVAGFSEDVVRQLKEAGYNVKHIPETNGRYQLREDLRKFLIDQNGIAEYPDVVVPSGAWIVPLSSDLSRIAPAGAIGGVYACENGSCSFCAYCNLEGKVQSRYVDNIKGDNLPHLVDIAITRAHVRFVPEKQNAKAEPVKRNIAPILVSGNLSDAAYLRDHGCNELANEAECLPSTRWLEEDFGCNLLQRHNSSVVMIRAENEQDFARVDQAKETARQMTESGPPICLAWYKDNPIDGRCCVFRDGKQVVARALAVSTGNALQVCIRNCLVWCERYDIKSNLENVKMGPPEKEAPAVPPEGERSVIVQVIRSAPAGAPVVAVADQPDGVREKMDLASPAQPAPAPTEKSAVQLEREENFRLVKKLQKGETLSDAQMQQLARAHKRIQVISEKDARKRLGQYASVTDHNCQLIPEKIANIFLSGTIRITEAQKKEIKTLLKLPKVIELLP